MRRKIALGGALLALASLGSFPAVPANADGASASKPGDVDLDAYLGNGPNAIVGTLTFTTKLFGKLTLANETVTLDPLIVYNWNYVKAIGDDLTADVIRDTPYDASLVKYNRKTVTDANGHFEFDHLQPGNYLLSAGTEYEHDTDRIEHQVVYGQDWNGNLTQYHNDRIKTKLHIEIDEVAATVKFTTADKVYTVTYFSVLGAHLCCDGEL